MIAFTEDDFFRKNKFFGTIVQLFNNSTVSEINDFQSEGGNIFIMEFENDACKIIAVPIEYGQYAKSPYT